jgi:hypothetical protein
MNNTTKEYTVVVCWSTGTMAINYFATDPRDAAQQRMDDLSHPLDYTFVVIDPYGDVTKFKPREAGIILEEV